MNEEASYIEKSSALLWSYEICIKNELDKVEAVSRWFHQIGTKHNISDSNTFRIDLVVQEILSNIINYGYGDGDEAWVSVKLMAEGCGLVLKTEDTGRYFNPLARETNEMDKTLAETEIGGLGIHLVRNYADECHYVRKENKNLFIMKFFK